MNYIYDIELSGINYIELYIFIYRMTSKIDIRIPNYIVLTTKM